MLRDIVVRIVEGVECPYFGFIPLKMCKNCPYFGGYVGFRQIRCKRR